MHNPFQEKIEEHESDVDYIKRALEGDAAALGGAHLAAPVLDF